MMRPPCAVQRDRCWTQRSTRWSAPVRDAEEKYVSLLRFLVLKGEGGVQLTPQVNYKLRDGLLVCLTGRACRGCPPRRSPLNRARIACQVVIL